MWLDLEETDSVEMPAWKRSAVRFRSLFQHFELEISSSAEHPLVTGWLGLNQISLWLVGPKGPPPLSSPLSDQREFPSVGHQPGPLDRSDKVQSLQ